MKQFIFLNYFTLISLSVPQTSNNCNSWCLYWRCTRFSHSSWYQILL